MFIQKYYSLMYDLIYNVQMDMGVHCVERMSRGENKGKGGKLVRNDKMRLRWLEKNNMKMY